MSVEGETESKIDRVRPVSPQERFDIEDRFIGFGTQFGSFWGCNWGVVYTILNSSTEEPLQAAIRAAVSIPIGMTVGLLAGGGIGVLASRIHLAGK